MSLFVDKKYVMLVSVKLDRFRKVGTDLFTCRCPLCGDSKKSKIKTRGYFIRDKNSMYYMCHNCTVSLPLWKFLKTLDKNLYSQYRLELYTEQHKKEDVPLPDYSMAKGLPVFTDKKIELPTIKELPDDHKAKLYVKSRMIPEFHWDRLYYADDFLSFCDKLFPEHGKKLPQKDERLVIPFWNGKKILQGVQGRTLSNSEIRYITIRAREDMTKVFGLDLIDFTKPINVVEGPIDSMFLKNTLATMDSALYRVIETAGDHDYVFVYDNEPRNKDVLKTMRKTINMGKKIVIFPSSIKEKDINDMVLAGINVEELIKTRTFQGPRAMLEFETWSKV